MIKQIYGRRSCLAWLCSCEESKVPLCRAPFPCSTELEFLLQHCEWMEPENRRRMVNMIYALAAVALPAGVEVRLSWPSNAGMRLRALYPDRASKEPLLSILDNLTALRESSDAVPEGTLRQVEGTPRDILHLTLSGKTEVVNLICSRSAHLYAADIGTKSVEVNPYGFTITVEEQGHNPDHSYFDRI